MDSARRRRSSSAQAVPWPSCRRVTEISGAGAATRRRRWKTCTEKGEAMGLGTEEPRLGPALPIRRCSTSTSKRRRAPGTIPVQSPKKSSEHWSTGAWAFFSVFCQDGHYRKLLEKHREMPKALLVVTCMQRPIGLRLENFPARTKESKPRRQRSASSHFAKNGFAASKEKDPFAASQDERKSPHLNLWSSFLWKQHMCTDMRFHGGGHR